MICEYISLLRAIQMERITSDLKMGVLNRESVMYHLATLLLLPLPLLLVATITTPSTCITFKDVNVL